MADFTNKPRNLRFYKPNKNGTGCASDWQIRWNDDNQYEPWLFFLTFAPQNGENDKGNAIFDWKEKHITVKLGDADLGEMIAVLERRKDSLGTKGSLFHQTPDGGGNKVISLNKNDNGGYFFGVSAQNAQKEKREYRHLLTDGEAAFLLVLLKRAVEMIYNW